MNRIYLIFSLIYIFFIFYGSEAKTIRVFWHFPKTGGTTLRHILSSDCEQNGERYHVFTGVATNIEQTAMDIFNKNISCIMGHMHSDLIKSIKRKALQEGSKVVVTTLLRDPVDREISNYYYTMDRSSKEPVSLISFLADHGGHVPLNAEQLKSLIDIVGISEHFSQTLSMLLVKGFLRNATLCENYLSRKVNAESPSADDLPADVQTALNRKAAGMFPVYKAALTRFESQIVHLTDEEKVEFHRYVAAIDHQSHPCADDLKGIGTGHCFSASNRL